MRHELKIHPEAYRAIVHRGKRHEIRKNDRAYREGDTLFMEEYCEPLEQPYTGRWISAYVAYVSHGGSWGLPQDIDVMTLTSVCHGTDAQRRRRA